MSITPCVYPLSNIRRAILQLNSAGFTGCQEPHCFPVHEPHLLQVKGDVCEFCFSLEELLQIGGMLPLDSATENEDRTSFALRSSNSEHVTRKTSNARTISNSFIVIYLTESSIHEVRGFTKVVIVKVGLEAF
jgi:hypothetical protein